MGSVKSPRTCVAAAKICLLSRAEKLERFPSNIGCEDFSFVSFEEKYTGVRAKIPDPNTRGSKERYLLGHDKTSKLSE